MASMYTTLATGAPSAPASVDICRLYGTIVDVQGRPLPNRTIEVLYEAFDEHPGGLSGTCLVSDAGKVGIFTRRDGSFQVDLLRGVVVGVRLPTSEFIYRLEVPDSDLAPLVYCLFPVPTLIRWVTSTSLDGTYVGAESPLEVALDAEIYVALEVLWSNGYSARTTHLYVTPSSSEAFDSEDVSGEAAALRVSISEPGDVTVTVLEEEMLAGCPDTLTALGFPLPGYPDLLPYSAHIPPWPEPLVLRGA